MAQLIAADNIVNANFFCRHPLHLVHLISLRRCSVVDLDLEIYNRKNKIALLLVTFLLFFGPFCRCVWAFSHY